jgi:coenzyme F420-dependent glucose-6-phosphate dehydrogenase
MQLGYALSSEEHTPADLVRYAQRAEEAGFGFALISDHFHPWTDNQGNSAFVWSVLGGIAQTTSSLRVGTGVTCPLIRTHPAIIAHAAATVADMMPGRFFLGVGTGENLNEHILGDHWPPYDVRAEMLEEAVDIIRLLWEGGQQSYRGLHYTLENARLYTLPAQLPEIIVAASGTDSAYLAAQIGDGLCSTSPKKEIVDEFRHNGGADKPLYGQITVCYARDEEEAKRTAHEIWPIAALGGQLSQELAVPSLFEAAAENVTPDQVAEVIVCGPDPQRHLDQFKAYSEAGYDHIYVHQVGPDQEGFFEFYQREIMPALDLVPPAMQTAKA